MSARDPSSTARCASGFSQHPDLAVAVGEVVGAVLEDIDPHPGCAMLFVAGPAAANLVEIAGAVTSLLAPEVLVAATASGVFGGTQEVAAPSGVGLLAIDVAGCMPLRFAGDDEAAVADGLPSSVMPGSVAMVLGAAGFRFGRCRATLERQAPKIEMVGAAPSPRSVDDDTRLFVGDRLYPDGAVGVLMPPGVTSVCSLGAAMFDDDGDEIPVVGPPEILDAAGLVLFADGHSGLLYGPTLDFDIIFEHMEGPVVGMAGRPFLHQHSAPGDLRTAIITPMATALMVRR